MAEAVGKPVMVGGGVVDGSPVPPTQVDMTSHMMNRRMVRAPANPLDKCTIVSIFPDEIPDEVKPTIEPSKFKIPSGSLAKPGVSVIGGASWWKDYDYTQPILEIRNSSIQVAESIVKDYCNGMLGCNMGDTMPGLFYVLGEHTSSDIVLKFQTKLKEMNAKQLNWYKVLVRLADSLWTRTNNNPLAIWDIMKTAARELNLNDKMWLKDVQMAEMIRCFACGSMKNPDYPICPTCRAIDPKHPSAKDIKFASL